MARSSPASSARGRAPRPRFQKRSKQQADDMPDVYQEMLEEAEARDPAQFSDKPIKRRRVGDTRATPAPETTVKGSSPQVQTIYDSDESEEESDVEWEDVDISQPAQEPPREATNPFWGDETLQITLDRESDPGKRRVPRRKPITAAEKRLRLDVHKVHVLCLLAHVDLRNRWCNDQQVQDFLKRMIPKRIRTLLHPNEDQPQHTKSITFVDGLNQTGELFNRRFRVTSPGLKRAHWAEDTGQLKNRLESIMSDAEVFLSKEDFQTQATTMAGSRDFGAQLFCALLRSVSIETRLVCSLQPLPFSGTVKDMNPSKEASMYYPAPSDDHETSTDDQNKLKSPMPSRTRRIGRPGFSERPNRPAPRPEPRPKPRESSYPVFWVEAFNEAMQRWVVVDPVVTKTIGKPSKLEPPASDPYNNMSYVVAFEDDVSARDVTRRYTKAFNAKTRKCRIESTKDGQKWWDNAMRQYEKPFVDDRDEAEVSELTSKSAQEPMPRNIQDFKDHPVYALERHVNRNQVIAPKRVIGHVGLSKTTANSDNLEPVYRRSDVHIVRSADKWYRLGRDVKMGEQPLKQVTAKRPKSGFASEEDEADTETDLYAEYQTEIYRPPPVVNGRVPKNGYGNLDVYVPSMVPPGAVHIKQPEAVRAARILGIDYADVVTGFDFRGRRGTAVFGGIAVAMEYQEAVEEVLRGMADERQQALLEEKSSAAVQLWRLFLIKLRITERVNSYAVEGEEKVDVSASEMDVDQAEEAGGGFLPEAGGGFFPEAGGGFFPEPGEPTNSLQAEIEEKEQKLEAASDQAGTSQSLAVPDQDDESGGGFIPDDTMDDSSAPVPTCVPTHAPTHAPATEPTLAPSPAALNHQAQSSKAKKPRATPRYELIVVPSKPDSVSQEPPKTPKRAPALEPEGFSEKAPIVVGSPTNAGSKSASEELVSRPASPKMSPSSRPLQDSDSEISKGSRLSEDPEDEDAFPEWLL